MHLVNTRPSSFAFGLVVTLFVSVFDGAIVDAGDLAFKKHVINDQTDYSAAAIIDVNHDGHFDIVCGGDWYQGPNWDKHFVAEIPRIGGRPDGFAHLEFDVNRDGWVDVITVNYRSRSIKWMEHPGESLGPWATHVAVEPGPMETGRLVDIDGDGQLDLLPNGANFAAWWEFRWNQESGASDPVWIRHDLPNDARGHGLGFGDIDSDGRGDIVGQNGWLKAPLDARNGQWQWHAEFNLERASIPMIVADVDEDGDSDVVWCSAHGFGVYWLEQTQASSGDRRWIRHAIDTSWSQGHSPLWVDLDGDGRNELLTGKRYMAHGGADPGEYDPIGIYRYQFQPETKTWQRWVVSPLGQRVGMGLDPKVADLDGDGDLDLVTSGRSGLYWLENLGPPTKPVSAAATPIYDHDNLLVVKDADGHAQTIDQPEAWGRRRVHVGEAISAAVGPIPGPIARVPLDVTTVSESRRGESYKSQRIRYRVDTNRQVAASLLIPNHAELGTAAGIVCMFDEAHRDLANEVAHDLAERGYVCVVPDPAGRSQSVSDQVWQAMRAADVLQASDRVHGERIGFVGDALAGQTGLYVAAIDQRFLVTVTDLSGATGLGEISTAGTHSLAELLASAAPRALNAILPDNADFASTVKHHGDRAKAIFALRNVADDLVFSDLTLDTDEREEIYAWLEREFRQRTRPASRNSTGAGLTKPQ